MLSMTHLYGTQMWRVLNDGSHSCTCRSHVHPQTQCAMPGFTPSRRASLHFGRHSFPVPLRVGGWVGLGGGVPGVTSCCVTGHLGYLSLLPRVGWVVNCE